MTKPIVILASSRSDGNTSAFAKNVFSPDTVDFVDLNQLNVGYFSYTNANAADDFLPFLESLLKTQVWVLATPLYWYTMSAQAKTFIDRLSDTIVFHKELGRQIRGKSFAVLCTGTDPALPTAFNEPFEMTCACPFVYRCFRTSTCRNTR